MSKLSTYAALFVLTLATLGACGPNQSADPYASRTQLSVDIIPPESIQKPQQAQKVPIVAQEQSMNFVADELDRVSDSEWKTITIPLTMFTYQGRQVNSASVENVNFGFHSGHGSGNICIDEIAFVK